ncbi:MAG: hypothetical protein V7K60_32210 [Nostoc sp.]
MNKAFRPTRGLVNRCSSCQMRFLVEGLWKTFCILIQVHGAIALM